MKQTQATLVGAFVLGALALAVAAVLLFAGSALSRQRVAIVSYFPGSVAGLRVGAAVTYRGVHVGEVKAIALRVLPNSNNSLVQVDMQLVPDAVKMYGMEAGSTREMLPVLVRHGLSAQLVMESFVTGQLQVDLDFRPGATARPHAGGSGVTEIPTVPSPFQALTHQLEGIDIAGTVATLQRTLTLAEGILGSPGVQTSVQQLPALVADMRNTLQVVQREVHAVSGSSQQALVQSSASLQGALTAVQSLAQTLEHEGTGTLTATRRAAESATTAMEGASALLDPHGDTVRQLQDAIDDFAATAARMRNVAERVDRDPAVLVRGRQP